MKVAVDDVVKVETHCETCLELEFMVVVATLVVWDDDGKSTYMDYLQCENCNTFTQSGPLGVNEIVRDMEHKPF